MGSLICTSPRVGRVLTQSFWKKGKICNDDDNEVNNKEDGQRSNFVGSGELKIRAVNYVTLVTETLLIEHLKSITSITSKIRGPLATSLT